MYLAIKGKTDALPKSKDGKSKAKKKSAKKKPKAKKADGKNPEYKDDFLPQITLRPTSYPNAETLLTQQMVAAKKVSFRPLHIWTEQETTKQLLEKKHVLRERFGWEVDFDDYRIPLIKNAMSKLEKIEN